MVTKLLDAPLDRVWQVISDGDRVERWFEWVEETVLEQPNEGGYRLIRMKDGSSFDEYITLNHRPTLTYQYFAPAPPLPVRDVLGTNRFEAIDGGSQTRMTWVVSFQRAEGAPDDLTEMMTGLYTEAMNVIERLAK